MSEEPLSNSLIFSVVAALALLGLAVILFRRLTGSPGYIPNMSLSRRGKWLLAALIVLTFLLPIWQHYVRYR